MCEPLDSRNATFAAGARKTIEQSGLHGRIYIYTLAAFEVTLCIGASFAFGSFETSIIRDGNTAVSRAVIPSAGWVAQ